MALLQNVIQRGTHAARPAAGSAGILYFETDSGQLFRDSGSAWELDDTTVLYTAKGEVLVASGSGTVGVLATGTDGHVLTADSTEPLGVGWAGTSGALTNLGESILSSDTATITFASISASYRDLHLSLTGRSDQSDMVSAALRFNADSGSNYDWTDWYNPSSNGSGSPSLEAVAANAMLRLGYVSGTNAPSGGCGAVRAVIHDYARTNWRKSVTSECQCERTLGASYRFTAGGTWRSTAAVTSITLVLAAGNFKSGTVATLWGAG